METSERDAYKAKISNLWLKQEYGFEEDNQGNLIFAQGSISNYTKIKLSKPYLMDSVVEDKPILAYHVEYEDFAEPGYLEIDHKTVIHCNVALSKIEDWLRKQHILGRTELEQMRKERDNRLAAKKAAMEVERDG